MVVSNGLNCFSQIDNPGEVVRITPRKGEVDYQGVHAKARPGFLYQDKDEGSLVLILRHQAVLNQ